MSKRKFKQDGLNRLLFEKKELKVLALRFFKNNQEASKENFLSSNIFSSKLSRGLYKFRNRCILTSRSRGVFSKLSISRVFFRKLFSKGFLPGYRKSSW
jgi:small subunit ribosomal protein S14